MADNKKQQKTDNDKAKEAGAKNANQKAPAASGFSVPERIWNFLTQEKGLGSVTTASIMGNIAQESMYNTSAVSSDGHGSIGICQWTNPNNGPTGRKTNLINFAKSIGKDPGDLEAQLQFLWKECEDGGYIAPMHTASQNKSSVDDKIAAEVESFCFGFERPAREYANLPNRIKYAKEAYEKQGKGILAAGTYSPGNSPANGFLGQTTAAKRGTVVTRKATEKVGHADEYEVKPLDPDKTFCEPIYPDLTSVGEEIPAYSVPNNIPTADMKLQSYEKAGAGLVYEVPTSAVVKYSDDKNLGNFIVLNQTIAKQRKEIFDKAKNRNAFKQPTAGKPPNNKDPFPVDHKIVELETHQPRCKIESVNACHHSLDVAKAVVLLSTDTEKRLVKIENNLATVMRYLYRMAARVNINCVYYGGQIPATYPAKDSISGVCNKYNCIRCLKDDRIQEGKQVSLDQCLNCTRYEPLIGQVYDILDDAGDNLSVILDDNQMSYTTMDEYYKFRNLEERQTPMESADLDAASVGERNISEIDLDDEWGPGLAMDWSLYPVELQKPHTNPPVEGSLTSAFGMNSGMGLTNGGVVSNMLIEARNQIDAGDSNAKQTGSEYAKTKTDQIAAEVKAKLGSQIREYYKSKNIITGQDQCLIAALMSVYGGQVGDTIDKLETAKSNLKGKGVDNIVLHVMFYSMDQKYLFGEGSDDKPPVRLDKVKKEVKTGSSSSDLSDSVTIMPADAWGNVAQWNWNNIAEPLSINIDGKNDTKKLPDQMLNFAKVVYLYKELLAKCSASRFDTAEWGFPFDEETINTAGLNTALRTMYFQNTERGRWHNGVDIGVLNGNGDKGNAAGQRRVPIHAVRDGIVVAAYGIDGNGGGNRVCLQHDSGYYSWYMHMSSISVQQNQKVNRGDIVGYTGGSGWSTMADYDEHLHLEIHTPTNQGWVGTVEAYGWPDDPLKYFAGNLANTFPIYYDKINP